MTLAYILTAAQWGCFVLGVYFALYAVWRVTK